MRLRRVARTPVATALALCASFAPLVRAQGDAATDDAAVRIQRLREEIAEERGALEAARTRGAEDLAALQVELRGKAAELLERAVANERESGEQTRLEAERARLAAELREQAEGQRSIAAGIQSLAERLTLLAQGLPGRESLYESARADGIALAQALETWPERGALPERAAAEGASALALPVESMTRTLQAAAELAVDLRRAQVRETSLRTAGGREERVRLLSLGGVAFAYTLDEARAGLALASPIDASAYRWMEDLEPEWVEPLRALVAAVAAGSGTLADARFPIDATGQVRPSVLQRAGLRAQIASGGPLMIPLALVAVGALLLCLERLWTLVLCNRGARALAHAVLDAARTGRLAEAEAHCAREEGVVARTLRACLQRRSQGKAAMEDAVQAQLLQELPPLTRFLRTLAILAGMAPLLGLLGTVTGIIQTFGVIKSLGTTDPTLMAGGIAVALVTTAAGLSIAIPTLLAHGLLKGRGDRLLSDAERYAAGLLTILAHGHVDVERERADEPERERG